MSAVADNLAKIKAALSEVTSREVEIVGVTKIQPIDKIEEGIEAGLKILGNNYAQEGSHVIEKFRAHPIEWHFIGHIQRRKVKFLPDYDCIQSLDRLEIAKSLNERLEGLKKKMSVFVEVNIGKEEQKSGVFPENLEKFLHELKGFNQLEIKGLMCLPPPLEPVEKRVPYFQQMRELFEKYQEFGLKHLSMGTTEDYLVAVREGATMIRLGTSLFGPRPERK